MESGLLCRSLYGGCRLGWKRVGHYRFGVGMFALGGEELADGGFYSVVRIPRLAQGTV